MKEKKKKFNRYTAFFLVIAIIYSVLGYKLLKLQVVKEEYYKERADMAALTEVPDPAPRGNIVDKKGVVLATNKQSYMLVYNETSDNEKYFFETMDKVFQLLKENKEQQEDDFELKINPFRFEFKTESESAKRIQEVRFKRDRGLNEAIERRLFPDKKDNITKFTNEQNDMVDKELLKISPEETYKLLVDKYEINPKKDFYNLLEQYKVNPQEAYKLILKRFNIKDSEQLKSQLDKYVKAKSKDAKAIFKDLISQYGIDKLEYDLELQRNYMIIKDTKRMQSYSGYKPVIIASNIEKNSAFIFLERLNDLPGIDVTNQPLRKYPFGELGSAFLGYISKISNNPEKYKEKGYDVSSDYIGTAGLEYVYEDRLRGSKGGRIVKLNKQGRVIEELGRREPYPGQTLQLTIDKDVQMAAETTLDKVMEDLRRNPNVSYDGVNTSNATRGAAVAINVKTGGVLALASRPGYDPNIFSTPGKLTTGEYNKFFNPDLEAFAKNYISARNLPVTMDELFPPMNNKDNKSGKVQRRDQYDIYPKPFFNYATSALTAPGSTFKPLTAIAGLEEGVITPTQKIYDKLIFTKYGYNGKDWNTESKGDLDVAGALACSNNYFFFSVGDGLYEKSLDTLASYAWKFGLGVDPKGKAKPSTGIEIPENFGQVFNVQSERNRSANVRMWNVYDDLKNIRKAKDGSGNEGIDIQIQNEDSEKIKDLKGKIQDTIKSQMRFKNVDNFSDTVKSLLKELVENTPALKNKKFTDGDISTALSKIYTQINAIDEETVRPGNVYNAAIGQGSNEFTPLQLANYVATIANGGNRYKVHLVDKFLDSNNNLIQEVKPEVIEKIDVKPETLKAVKEGMKKVTEDGTASALNNFPIENAGKTGSATFNEKLQDKIGRTSAAVFVGFAPYDNPEIAICIFVFDGGHGGELIPVAEAMYEQYFKDELKKKNYNFKYNYDK
ncbi:penicillin-binding protein 2 [Clostridium tetanomorphum]|nr:penicillin-binding transpeptidase domain-containing protein [Clostridium tetanomorphum]KAJ53802.1 penicillin-binding protein 2 [Clostridium tetanomorphum DSM 665]MBP1862535.1 penicillin-binding protein 2 [Clostridium tetanomorphum]NRS85624.1 penicillin-binding protein 2 [Clostridium tetanomorphum]NRZ96365.1 penicillin-binding protein 2 [Clostridium tetanomorphum]SQC02648.1 penicillin-binding protein 2 [Clostridium tetanomorphum]